MAIYIDEHRADPVRNDDLIYQYLYHLVYMLARKRCFFHRPVQYDDFSLYAATKVFLRIFDKRCFADPPTLTPVKSCLNYIKRVLYPYKVSWEQSTFDQSDATRMPGVDSSVLNCAQYPALWSANREFACVDFKLYLSSLHLIVREHLKRSPYTADPVVW